MREISRINPAPRALIFAFSGKYAKRVELRLNGPFSIPAYRQNSHEIVVWKHLQYILAHLAHIVGTENKQIEPSPAFECDREFSHPDFLPVPDRQIEKER